MYKNSQNVYANSLHIVNAVIVGKPGTGKTTLANMLGATLGMPVYVVNPNKNSEE